MNNDQVQNINGLLVGYHVVPGLQTVYLNLAIRAGSWYETGENWGKMHLIEHLLFKGTQEFPSKTQLDDFMEDNGIQCNCSTGGAKIEVVMRFPSSSIDPVLKLLSQMVFHPLLRQEDIIKELKVLSREFTDKWSKTDIRFAKKVREQLFGKDSIYVRDGIGNPELLTSVDAGKLNEIHSQLFISSNMFLGLAGGFDEEELSTKLASVFEKMEGKTPELYDKFKINSGDFLIKETEEKINSSSIMISWLTGGLRDYSVSERILMSLGTYMIGGSRRSILSKKVRDEMGLAYGISANTYLYPTAGWFQINTSTKPDSVEEVTRSIKSTISDFLGSKIDSVSLLRAKNYIKWQRLLQNDSGASAAGNISDSLYWDGKLLSTSEFEAILDGITEVNLKLFFKALTSKQPFVAILEPKKLEAN